MVLAIPESEGRYTRSDKKILEFIEESTEEFLFMSIGQLAERLEMSEATISRFARHIGYGDFKELKSAVAQQKNGKGAARKMAGTLMKGEGFDIESWFSYQQECMMRTLSGSAGIHKSSGSDRGRAADLHPCQECFRCCRTAFILPAQKNGLPGPDDPFRWF